MKKTIFLSFVFMLVIFGCTKKEPFTAPPAATPTQTQTVTIAPTFSSTPTFTDTATFTSTPTITQTATITPTSTITPTFTITPDCSYAFGDNADDNTGYWLGGYLITRPASPSLGQSVNALWVKLEYDTSFRAGIYDDDGTGKAGVLLTQSAVISGKAGWNYAPITPYAVTAGHQYQLAVITQVEGVSSVANGADVKYRTQSWPGVVSSGLPADGSSGGWYDIKSGIKIYSAFCN